MHPRPRLLVFLLGLLPLALPAQSDSSKVFPRDYQGKWGGTMEIFRPTGLAQTIASELHILPLNDSTWTYTLIYGEDKVAGKRDYLIRRGPDGPHHWVCDEQNTILLDGYHLGDAYHSVFSVMGTYLVSTLEHRGDHLVMTFQSGSEQPIRTSGDEVVAGDTIPPVNAYKVAGYQRATLRLLPE